jgi:hypothetical protein
VGYPQDRERWQQLSDHMRNAVRRLAWDEKAGLFLEGPGRKGDGFSQHSQAMAILAKVTTPVQQQRILKRLTSDSRLHRMKFMQSFYLARALEKAGGYNAFASHVLSLWRDAMAKHVTTWPEYPDPTRSDCHAWSSWIAADFITCILGVQPMLPGYSRILLQPHIEACQFAEGSAPTPLGKVSVLWHKTEGNKVHLQANVPEGIPVLLKLPGVELIEYLQGGNVFYDGPYKVTDVTSKQ